jgi:hypothetical protein
MSYIEFLHNPIEIQEKNEKEAMVEKMGISSFWEWENKICINH